MCGSPYVISRQYLHVQQFLFTLLFAHALIAKYIDDGKVKNSIS
jgi:hypothetical protein